MVPELYTTGEILSLFAFVAPGPDNHPDFIPQPPCTAAAPPNLVDYAIPFVPIRQPRHHMTPLDIVQTTFLSFVHKDTVKPGYADQEQAPAATGVSTLNGYKGRKAVITGASRGLGRAMAVALARAGMDVVGTGRDMEAMRQTLAEIEAVGGKGTAYSLDVTDSAAVAAFAAEVWSAGPVDVVIANAGISLVKPALDTTDDEFMRVIEANVLGTFATLRAFAGRMRERGSGKLLTVTSDIGIRGSANWAAYSASKGAIVALTKTLAWEWAPSLTVNAIAPGAFATDINSHLLAVPQIMSAIESETPLGRVGRPDEIGPLALFLAGPGSDFMTGQIISIDGGIQKS